MARNGVSVEIAGLPGLQRALRDRPETVRRAVGRGLSQAGEEVMADSKANYVPVRSGALRATGRVEAPATDGTWIRVALGYGGPAAPYALWVHEGTRRMRGRKYLERPLDAHASRIPNTVAAAVRREL